MEIKKTFLDRAISYFSPSNGLRRYNARAREHLLQENFRRFEGASAGRRTAGWRVTGASANAELRLTLPVLRNRTRDLVQNDPYATKGLRVLANGIVGAGIMPQFRAAEGGNEKLANSFSDLCKEWADSVYCSNEERSTFYALQWLAARSMVESGEVLIRKKRNQSLRVPLQIEILEADFLDTRKEELTQDGFTIQGVSYNKAGKRTGYWLFDRHPGEVGLPVSSNFRSSFFPASEVLHIFEVLRPGQVRGIPWFSPLLIKFKDLSDFSDYTLLRQKIASLFTAFVVSSDGGDDVSIPGITSKPTNSEVPNQLEAGAIVGLPSGKSMVFPSLPTPNGYGEVTTGELRAVAAGLGITYEALTGDYSKVNFSSARMAAIEFNKAVDVWRWHTTIPLMCDGVMKWFREAAAVAGFDNDKVLHGWTPPKRDLIDPGSETNAAISQIRAGIKTRSEVIRENGDDPDKVNEELAADNKVADDLGLILDSDARKVMKAGILQPEPKNPQESSINANQD